MRLPTDMPSEPRPVSVSGPMTHDHLIHFLIRQTQGVLRDNLAGARAVPSYIAVNTIRALVHAPAAQTALEKGSDTVRAFALRAMCLILRDHKQPPRVILDRLRSVLDEANLDRALGAEPQSRMNLRPRRPHAQ
jgi:hypothetical protein